MDLKLYTLGTCITAVGANVHLQSDRFIAAG